jgi:hypothetical protein
MVSENNTDLVNKYKKANGYYKLYNKHGVSCRIKIEENVQEKVIIKFKIIGETKWMYYAPSRLFKSQLEITHYILTNLESKNLVFKVLSTSNINKG